MEQRIIKFKAKRLDNGKWIKGYYYEECSNTYIIEDRQKKSMLNRNHPHQVDPSTVCQFTGLKDKDGKAIYEHDLIKCRTTLSYSDWDEWTLAEVVYIPGSFVLRVGGDEDAETVMSYFDHRNSGNVLSFELIGSKFDRKEEK